MNPDEKSRYYLKTLGTAFEVMDILSNRLEPMSISELDKELQIGKSKIHRILDTLKYWDYVDQDIHSRKYLLGYKVLVLAMNKLKSMDIVDMVIPYLEELVNKFGETVHLGILDQGEVLYLAKKQGVHAMGIISKVGQKLPAHCTGLGKVLLAHLKERELDEILNTIGMPKMAKNTITDGEILKKELREIREKEFAIENEEISEGLCCISAPIKNHEGEIIAAISMSIPTIRFNDEREKIIVKELKKTVLEISKQLGLQNSKT